MGQQVVDLFFAWAPMAALLTVLLATYFAARKEAATVPSASGKTYACANCGRRGKRDHMVPVSHEGAVVWYCGRCAH